MGDGAGYLLGLAELDSKLRSASGEAQEGAWQDAVDQARYGGQVPPAEELEKLARSVERRLADLRPDPEKHARESLKLKD